MGVFRKAFAIGGVVLVVFKGQSAKS